MSMELGAARGSITVDTSQLATAQASVKTFSTGVTASLNAITPAAKQGTAAVQAVGPAAVKAGEGVKSLTANFKELAAAFGLSLGVAGVVQIARITTELAVASAGAERTRKSFDTLAKGVGDSGNSMLASMQKASRGMISDNDLILAANKAVMLGVANNSQEMGQLLDASRVLSQAAGEDVTKGFNDLVVGLGRLSPLILDNLLIANEGEMMFENYAKSIGRTADSLTKAEKKQILLNQVMAAAKPLLAAEAKGADLAADKYDRLGASWTNYLKALGGGINTVGQTTGVVETATGALDVQTGILQTLTGWWNAYADAVGNAGKAHEQQLREQGFNMGGVDLRNKPAAGVPAWMTGVSAAASGPLQPEGARQVKLDWAQGVQDLNKQTNDEILSQTTDYNNARADSERDYQKASSREAAAFARQRLRDEMNQLDAIADVAKAAARREGKALDDLERSLGEARAASAERDADIRKESVKRLADIEESYAEDREKAARQHTDNLRDAARDLNAKAVADEQHQFSEQESDAKKAHDKAVKDNGEQLQERLDDEAKSLAKSLKQQQDAHDRQLSEARENDRLRLEEMKADFVKRKTEEDADRVIRLGEQAADHAAQLTEMETQHGLRLEQIRKHAGDQRTTLDEQAKTDLLALQVRNDAWKKAQEAKEKAQEDLWDKFMGHVTTSLGGKPGIPATSSSPAGFASGGWVGRSGLAMVHSGEFMLSRGMLAGAQPIPMPVRNAAAGNGGSSRSITIEGGIHLHGVATDSPEDFARKFDERLRAHAESWSV